jgi:hypothetical protein
LLPAFIGTGIVSVLEVDRIGAEARGMNSFRSILLLLRLEAFEFLLCDGHVLALAC